MSQQNLYIGVFTTGVSESKVSIVPISIPTNGDLRGPYLGIIDGIVFAEGETVEDTVRTLKEVIWDSLSRGYISVGLPELRKGQRRTIRREDGTLVYEESKQPVNTQ